MSVGVCRKTGRTLGGWDHFVAMAEDVLSTQIGSREKRPFFGSRLPELLAKNDTDGLLMLAQVYAAEALGDANNGLVSEFTVSRVLAGRIEGGIRLAISGSWRGSDVTFYVNLDRG